MILTQPLSRFHDSENRELRTENCFSQRMQIGEQIAELLIVQNILGWRHIAAAEHDGVAGAVIVGRSAAGQVFLAEHPLQSRTLARAAGVGVVTDRASRLEDVPAAFFLRS